MEYKKYFTISYDDGLEQDKRIVELMKKYGINGTFNLNSGLFGLRTNIQYIGNLGYQNVGPDVIKQGLIRTAPAYRIPEDEIRQVYAGFELATHGVHHMNEGKLSEEDLRKEIREDRKRLSEFTDLPVVGHAFPFGGSSALAERVLQEEGILYARGVSSSKGKGEKRFSFPTSLYHVSPTCSQIDGRTEKLFDEFMRTVPTQGDMLFYMWGHGYEIDFQTRRGRKLMDMLERMFSMVAKDDSIISCTNNEAFSAHYGW